MGPSPPSLAGLLCDPITRAPVREADGGYTTGAGAIFPIADGFPDFRIARPPLRHRFWAWVYNRTSFGYDFGVRVGWRLAFGGSPIDREAYLSRLDIRPGMRVLETAVGTGANLLALPGSAQYYGLDHSRAMLRRCRNKLDLAGHPAALVLADMAAAPFVDGVFDLVFHVGGLQFLSNPRRGVEEMHRMARHEGRVLIVEERASEAGLVARSGAGALRDLAPVQAEDVHIETISGGELIALEFRKQSE